MASEADASRQVGAADVTPRPMVAPNDSKIDERAVAISAPRIIGVQFAYRKGSSAGTPGSTETGISAQPEERQDRHDDDDQTYQINQTIHILLLFPVDDVFKLPGALSAALFFAASTTRPTLSVMSSAAARVPSAVRPCSRASSAAASITSMARLAAFSTC